MIDITRLLCGSTTANEHLRYRRGIQKDRRPVVVWNTTRRCNLRCVHCYAHAQDRPAPGELGTNQALALIDDLAAFRVPVLLFSGGEPLLRPDLMRLGAHAVERGIRAVISTNGTLLTPEQVEAIRHVGFSYVGVSIDGLRDTNDRFRGVPGAFDQALQGIRNCLAAGVKVGLRFTISRRNAGDLAAIFDLLLSEGIPRCCVYHLVYAGRGSKLVHEDQTRDEARASLDLIMRRTRAMFEAGNAKEVLTVDNHSDGPYLYLALLRDDPDRAEEAMRLLKWNGGNSSGAGIACIDDQGEVHPDQFWRHYTLGNVQQRKFPEIWTDAAEPLLRDLRRRKSLVKGRCAECRFLDACNANMRVRAEAVSGDIWAEEPACLLTDQEIGIA